jgi:hypothetical protein
MPALHGGFSSQRPAGLRRIGKLSEPAARGGTRAYGPVSAMEERGSRSRLSLDCTFVFSKEGWQLKHDKYELDGVKLDIPAALARELIKRATEWARENQAGYVQRQRGDFFSFIGGSLSTRHLSKEVDSKGKGEG